VLLHDTNLHQIMEFYMGKNTPDRQEFIIDNLRIELDKVEKGAEGKIALEEQPEDTVA
jgi:topoisomerase-4 subunit B